MTPSTSRDELVSGAVPTPANAAVLGDRRPQINEAGGLFVRDGTSHIAQDFSVVQPVANHGPGRSTARGGGDSIHGPLSYG